MAHGAAEVGKFFHHLEFEILNKDLRLKVQIVWGRLKHHYSFVKADL